MTDSRLVCQEGIVVGIKETSVQVRILTSSACSQCHAKGMCSAMDTQERIIDAVPAKNEVMQLGDTVTLIMEEKMGWLAVFYGFFLPFVVLVTVFLLTYGLGCGEIPAALLGTGSLVLYYLVLYMFRKRIEKDFVFKVEKKSTNR